MFNSAQTLERRFLGGLARWWRDRGRRRRTVHDLDCCDAAEVERMAHDVGIGSRAELRVLASKWPNSVDLLSARMQQLDLDTADVVRAEPGVLRDMQRVCSFCKSKRRCEHDLQTGLSAQAWREYCPNETTLDALVTERSNKSDARAT